MEILNKIDLFQKDINELRPFEGGMLGQIQDYYRVGLTWTSNALEGNSLTESETKVLLEDGLRECRVLSSGRLFCLERTGRMGRFCRIYGN